MQTQDRGHAPQPSPRSSRATPPAPRTAARPTQCFSVQALADPGTLPRVVEVFAKRGLVPIRVHASRATTPKEDLIVDVHLADTDSEQARLIAQELRRQFCVDAVLVVEKSPPADS
jgi:acetolactate synthase regulatory subunit